MPVIYFNLYTLHNKMQAIGSNPLLSLNDANTNRALLFTSLLGSSEAVPLDNNNMFSLIRSNKYQQLLATLQESQELKGKLEQLCHTLSLENRQLNREVELYMGRMGQFKNNEALLEGEISRLNSGIREREGRVIQLEVKLKEMQIKADQQQTSSFPFALSRRPPTCETAAQTYYLQQESPEVDLGPVLLPSSQTSPESMQNKLYMLLRTNAERFQSQFKARIKALEECQVQVQNWQSEKKDLLLENERLKEMAALKGEEEEKIRIWQESIAKLMENVERNIDSKTQEGVWVGEGGADPEGQEEWVAEAVRRGRLAELRLRVREAEQLMAVQEEQGEEEGPVVALVKLTQRVKTLVRGMLAESQCIS